MSLSDLGLGWDSHRRVAMPDRLLGQVIAFNHFACNKDRWKLMPELEIGHRPWGYYEVLLDDPAMKVKRIVVQPGGRLSLQRHQQRAEHWFVAQGEARVSLDGQELLLRAGQSVDIPQRAWHRVQNTSDALLVLVEVQTGVSFSEEDIERQADDYGRA